VGEDSLVWDVEEEFNPERSGWADKVRSAIPRIEEDEMVLLRRLERKFNKVKSKDGLQTKDPMSQQKGRGKGAGIGDYEVISESEETGFVGPSE